MLKINFQMLINLHQLKLLNMRHISNFQIRVTVHQLQKNQKIFKPLTPYLILSPEVKQKKKQIKSSTNNKSHKKIQRTNTSNNNVPEIDDQTKSFLTKNFTIRSLETYNDLKQITVFKGDFQVSIEELLNQQSGLTSKNQLNKVFVCLQLLQTNNFSSQAIDNWIGFSIVDQGNIFLPINFYQINLTINCQIVFLWSSIELVNYQSFKNIQSTALNKLSNKIDIIFKHQQQKILSISKLFNNNNKYQKSLQQKNQKSLAQNILFFNEKTYYLWKRFQQDLQIRQNNKQLSEDFFEQKRTQFINNLNLFHWKNNIKIPETKDIQSNKYYQALLEVKNNTGLNQNLIFYPFDEHKRSLNVSYQDFKKAAPLSSLCKSNFNQKQKKFQLIIFVHGYQASSFDMQTLAVYFKSKNPSKIATFVSNSNQGKTQQNIQQLAHRLAVQIKNYINHKLQLQLNQFQISFVCHSMGGLIARASLRYLQIYKKNFRTFLSLSSPHLGYIYHHSTLIKTSLWVLNQVKKDPSMIELTMQDHKQLQKTYLYELSMRIQLEWFKFPIFVASKQDEYVPFWSALVQDKDFFFQTHDAKIYKSLYRNLTQKIQDKIIRLQVTYQDKVRDLSTFVGRTAHIRILNCIQVMQMLYLLFQKAF